MNTFAVFVSMVVRIARLFLNGDADAARKIEDVKTILDRKTQVSSTTIRFLAECYASEHVFGNLFAEEIFPVNIEKSWGVAETIAYLKTLDPPMQPASFFSCMWWYEQNPDECEVYASNSVLTACCPGDLPEGKKVKKSASGWYSSVE